MQTCLITFLSQTQANRFRAVLQRSGVAVLVVQTPKEISRGGCSYGARINRRELGRIIGICRENGVSFSRVFAESVAGNGRRFYEEIKM